MADRANCPNMEEEGRCARPREIPRHHTFKSHHEAAREDTGWEDPRVEQELGEEQQGFRKGRGTTDGMLICIKTAGREEVGDARENGSGICGPMTQSQERQ